jgi:signal transduction histidine kinase
MDLHFSEISLSELVVSSIREMDYWIEERGFKISTEIQKGINISADPDALKQALLNLISNSIKFSYDERELNIRLWEQDKYIYIEVGDRGIGIPEDKIDRIFEKYYRIDSSKVIDSSGTGLGLTVTKNIIESHNGIIRIESEIGQGTKVTIRLNQDPEIGK